MGADKHKPSPKQTLNVQLLAELLRPSPLYAIYFCHFSWNVCLYICVMWLPTYLENQYNLNSKQTWINALPYLVMAPSAMGWGWVVDLWLANSHQSSKRISSNMIRKVATAVGFMGGAVGLMLFCAASTPHVAILLLCGTFFISSLSLCGWEAAKLNALDSSKAGMLQGVSNTISNFAGVIGVPLASYIKEMTDSWEAVWIMCATVWVAAAIVYILFAADNNNDDKSGDYSIVNAVSRKQSSV
mmetsp:Transcript_4470/g.7185  ORF Transcript_4470/g.7185 Transcript_4470/m.7185 type:complete len:243 (-) Transcript_4470:89-817(-)